MTLYRSFSKMQIARIFAVSRSTVYDWEIRGCPVRQPDRPGRPAKLDFEAVLDWYLTHEDTKGVSEEGLAMLEKAIRGRKDKHYG
ncbi:MAG: hypothetical protein HZC50_09650 [Nitrospirae bacterium]|nr:hypothetical protein [Nitrospirota bacterium]